MNTIKTLISIVALFAAGAVNAQTVNTEVVGETARVVGQKAAETATVVGEKAAEIAQSARTEAKMAACKDIIPANGKVMEYTAQEAIEKSIGVFTTNTFNIVSTNVLKNLNAARAAIVEAGCKNL